jgi:hypothetical protein
MAVTQWCFPERQCQRQTFPMDQDVGGTAGQSIQKQLEITICVVKLGNYITLSNKDMAFKRTPIL